MLKKGVTAVAKAVHLLKPLQFQCFLFGAFNAKIPFVRAK
jgi:hypothetical protein